MAELNRRTFLSRGSMAVAGVGLLGSAQAVVLPSVLGSGPHDEAGDGPAAPGAAEGTVVAHVRDWTTGEIGILTGTREVIVHDPAFVARLARAAR